MSYILSQDIVVYYTIIINQIIINKKKIDQFNFIIEIKANSFFSQ